MALIDIEDSRALAGYLRETLRVGGKEMVGVRVLAGGVSNKTVLVTRESGEAWVLKQALPQLRVAVEWHADPRRIEREAAGIRHLLAICPTGTITPLVFEDAEQHLLAMEAVPEPHENFKQVLLSGHVAVEHVEQFAELLATIHRAGHERRGELAGVFGDRSFFESLRLEPYYLYAAGQVAEAETFLKELVEQTRGRRLTLVHGDYSPKNVLIRGGRLILLDHEVIHFGDPAFDVGFAMTHLLSKAHRLRAHRAAFEKAARKFWGSYFSAVGRSLFPELERFAARHTLACLLARVAGRSPLEYLDVGERQRQREAVVGMMGMGVDSMEAVVEGFLARI